MAVGTFAAQAPEHAHVRSGHATAISARKINKGHQLSAACPESQTCDGSTTPFETWKNKRDFGAPAVCVWEVPKDLFLFRSFSFTTLSCLLSQGCRNVRARHKSKNLVFFFFLPVGLGYLKYSLVYFPHLGGCQIDQRREVTQRACILPYFSLGGVEGEELGFYWGLHSLKTHCLRLWPIPAFSRKPLHLPDKTPNGGTLFFTNF